MRSKILTLGLILGSMMLLNISPSFAQYYNPYPDYRPAPYNPGWEAPPPPPYYRHPPRMMAQAHCYTPATVCWARPGKRIGMPCHCNLPYGGRARGVVQP